MSTLKEAAAEFLAKKRVAITGVSRNPQDHGGNVVYRRLWMHRAFGSGSVSEAAAAWGREHGMRVIEGGCPLMFEPAADPSHKLMRFVSTLAGKAPRRIS